MTMYCSNTGWGKGRMSMCQWTTSARLSRTALQGSAMQRPWLSLMTRHATRRKLWFTTSGPLQVWRLPAQVLLPPPPPPSCCPSSSSVSSLPACLPCLLSQIRLCCHPHAPLHPPACHCISPHSTSHSPSHFTSHSPSHLPTYSESHPMSKEPGIGCGVQVQYLNEHSHKAWVHCGRYEYSSQIAWIGSAGLQALKALMRREATLVQRNSFLYIFKAVQV